MFLKYIFVYFFKETGAKYIFWHNAGYKVLISSFKSFFSFCLNDSLARIKWLNNNYNKMNPLKVARTKWVEKTVKRQKKCQNTRRPGKQLAKSKGLQKLIFTWLWDYDTWSNQCKPKQPLSGRCCTFKSHNHIFLQHYVKKKTTKKTILDNWQFKWLQSLLIWYKMSTAMDSGHCGLE